MNFPVYIHLFGYQLHPHPVLEGIGYFLAARVYSWLRKRSPLKAEAKGAGGGAVASSPAASLEANLWLLVGCVFGAWFGSKLLAWAESPAFYWSLRHEPYAWLGGKTIVGGILGAWAGIEIVKRCLGLRQSTGDAFVIPLALGTAIGRIGCFFTGLTDRTYGVATALPWGVDFGDGVPRHPTQLYESVYVLLLALGISVATRRRELPAGGVFRAYVVGYLGFRFLIEFIKPREYLLPGLSAIQVTCVVASVLALVSARRLLGDSGTRSVRSRSEAPPLT